jgi:hypothetical protein
MRTGALGLLVLALAASARLDAMCARVGPESTVLLRGTVVECRSALPELEAAIEKHREAYEERRESFRSLPNFDSLTALQPYDEQVASRLSRVQGVIVTFEIDDVARIPVESRESPAASWEDSSGRWELFLEVGGSSCDRLPDPAPTVLVQGFHCCDVVPSSDDSCLLDLQPASLPEASLLEQAR